MLTGKKEKNTWITNESILDPIEDYNTIGTVLRRLALGTHKNLKPQDLCWIRPRKVQTSLYLSIFRFICHLSNYLAPPPVSHSGQLDMPRRSHKQLYASYGVIGIVPLSMEDLVIIILIRTL